ncbi:MAG: hypothetical protein H0W64_04960 [Gammaproteobacteria bacterium]|nr:hypothetical protein [Gammaproteobacteria bacterium]
MSAIPLLCNSIGTYKAKLSREEKFIAEAGLFTLVCDEIKKILKAEYKNYFCLMKFNEEMENTMLDANFLRFVISDILLSGEYSLEGVAYYTQSPEEVICDVVSGTNIEPSLPLSRKIINLHKSVRPNLYQEIMKKIIAEYLP